jgi:hypothetical protein
LSISLSLFLMRDISSLVFSSKTTTSSLSFFIQL